jgi:L-asparaginase
MLFSTEMAKRPTPRTQTAKLKNILIVYTGGTFGMSPGLTFETLNAAGLQRSLFEQVPELRQLAQCTVQVLFQMDSCQFGAEHWLKLAEHLRREQNHYDGIVVLHGTDTLAYSAAALSYLLSPTRVPIVITGAQKPLSTLRNDARTNLISAIEVASHAPASLQNRVMVAFHDELFLGSRVRKKSALDFGAFESPRFPKLASIGSQIQYHEIVRQLPRLPRANLLARHLPKLKRARCPQILRTEVTPVFPGEFLIDSARAGGLDAVLLTLYTSGTAPTAHESFRKFLDGAREIGLPIYAITEREDAAIKLTSYPSGKELVQAGVEWCANLTPEAAFVKIWLTCLLGHAFSKRLSDEL